MQSATRYQAARTHTVQLPCRATAVAPAFAMQLNLQSLNHHALFCCSRWMQISKQQPHFFVCTTGSTVYQHLYQCAALWLQHWQHCCSKQHANATMHGFIGRMCCTAGTAWVASKQSDLPNQGCAVCKEASKHSSPLGHCAVATVQPSDAP
jgi:hypothetical protein